MNEFLEKFRQQYPDYADMSDADLAQALHTKFYSDIPYERFAGQIGLAGAPSGAPVALTEDPRFGQPVQSDAATYENAGGPGVGVLESVLRGARDVGQGVKQLGMMATGSENLPAYTEQVNQERAAFAEQQGGGRNPFRLVGQAIATAPAALIPGGQAAFLPRVASAALAGGVGGAAQFAPSGTTREKITQTGVGAVTALIAGEALRGLARLMGSFSRRTDPLVPGQSMTPTQAGREVQDAIRAADDRLSAQVDALYDAARSAQGVDDAVGYAGLGQRVQGALADFDQAADLPPVVAKRLRDLGSKADDVTVRDLVDLRRLVNRRTRITRDETNVAALSAVRGAVDDFMDDLQAQSPAIEAFRTANRAAFERQQALGTNALSKTIRDQLEPDNFIRSQVVGGTVRDLQALKNVVLNEAGDQQAWETARRAVVDWLNDRATGQAGFSASRYTKDLANIGDEKLALLFSSQEIAALRGVGQQTARALTQQIPFVGRGAVNAMDIVRGMQGPMSVDRLAGNQARGVAMDRLLYPYGSNPLAALIGAGTANRNGP
jgi:hypothetical protein